MEGDYLDLCSIEQSTLNLEAKGQENPGWYAVFEILLCSEQIINLSLIVVLLTVNFCSKCMLPDVSLSLEKAFPAVINHCNDNCQINL